MARCDYGRGLSSGVDVTYNSNEFHRRIGFVVALLSTRRLQYIFQVLTISHCKEQLHRGFAPSDGREFSGYPPFEIT